MNQDSRDGFRDLMRRLHGANGPFRSSTRETPELHVRFLGPDVAIVHTRFHIYGDVDESERTSIGTRGRIQEHARIRARESKVSRETVSPLRQSPRMRLTKSKLCADGRPAQLKASNSVIRARTRARVF